MAWLNPARAKIIQECIWNFARLIPKEYTKQAFHNALQTKVVELADEFNLKGIAEYYAYNWHEDGRVGLIDVVWVDYGKPLIAFEIDAATRVKSIQKLLAFDVSSRVWIYYGKRDVTNILNENDTDGLIQVFNMQGVRLFN